jgi:hypothetical protein
MAPVKKKVSPRLNKSKIRFNWAGTVKMMKYWHEKRKTHYLTKNVESTFFNDARQTSIFWFFPVKYAIKTRKSMK